jgi:hypothetical protein
MRPPQPRQHSNRQQRRRERASKRQHLKQLHDGVNHLSRSGPMNLTIVNRIDLLHPDHFDPEILAAAMKIGVAARRGDRPLCLTCDHAWTDLECEPPAGFAVLRTEEFFRHRGNDGGDVALVSAICSRCGAGADLLARCLQAYRMIWPGLRIATIMGAPGGVQ